MEHKYLQCFACTEQEMIYFTISKNAKVGLAGLNNLQLVSAIGKKIWQSLSKLVCVFSFSSCKHGPYYPNNFQGSHGVLLISSLYLTQNSNFMLNLNNVCTLKIIQSFSKMYHSYFFSFFTKMKLTSSY